MLASSVAGVTVDVSQTDECLPRFQCFLAWQRTILYVMLMLPVFVEQLRRARESVDVVNQRRIEKKVENSRLVSTIAAFSRGDEEARSRKISEDDDRTYIAHAVSLLLLKKLKYTNLTLIYDDDDDDETILPLCCFGRYC